MASEKSTVKRPFSESSSVTSPEYKRPNINISSDDIDAELAEIENLLLEEAAQVQQLLLTKIMKISLKIQFHQNRWLPLLTF